MKLVDEAVVLVVHAGAIDETKAARRKASPESRGVYAGLMPKWYLRYKPRSGWLPKHMRVRWRHPLAFLNTSIVVPKALLQDRRACPLFFDPFFQQAAAGGRNSPAAACTAFQFQLQPMAVFSGSGAKLWSSPAVLPRNLRIHRGESRASPLPADIGLPEPLDEVRRLLCVHTRIT